MKSKLQQMILKRVSDGSGSLIGVLITAAAFTGLRTFTQRRLTNNLAAVMLLQSDPVTGSGITLIFCIVLVVLLHQSYPITKDVWICGAIFGFLHMVAATITLCISSTWSATVFGLIHILITFFEGFVKLEKFPLLVAIFGFVGGCLLPLAPPPRLSEISAYKVATFIGGLSRFLDIVFIMGLVPRDKINNFLAKTEAAGFTIEERESFEENFTSKGLVDTFRKQHPNQRISNKGWRLDYFLLSESIVDKVHELYILPDVSFSDHSPIGLVLKL